MHKFMFRLALVLTAGLAAAAQAQPKKAAKPALVDQYSGQGYGVAGCGLGSMVFGPKKGLIQVLAATVNGTFGSQTFGITSGTSNCDIPEMGQQAAVFIEVNKEVVAKDAARGEGETITALADILECKSAANLGQAMKADYQTYFGDKVGSYETVRRLFNNGVCKKG